MKKFILSVLTTVVVCAFGVAHGQTLSDATTVSTQPSSNSNQPIRIDGLVVESKKYSFTVDRDGTKYNVRIAPETTIGLKMNKPWMDWENKQVVVDALPLVAGQDAVDLKNDSAKRVAIGFPAEQMYLLSRLADKEKLKQFKKQETKRLNFYLITPVDPGKHAPTTKEPFLAGPLSFQDKQTVVTLEEEPVPVRLGFRYATMNGFSINQLQPNKTQVFLTGTLAQNGEGEILASRILFQPIDEPMGSSANDLFGSAPESTTTRVEK